MRLILADDAALLREGLIGLLERQGHEIAAHASTAPELEAAVNQCVDEGRVPDVVVTDVRMPPNMTDDGLAAAARIRRRHPQIGILVLSQYIAPAYATELFTADTSVPDSSAGGGLGYLLKERVARVADFIRSLETVADGGVVIDPQVGSRLIAGERGALDALTRRETDVLELMAQGLSNAQIAEQLVLSAGAVAKHVANIFTKLQLPPGEDNRRVRAVLTYLGHSH